MIARARKLMLVFVIGATFAARAQEPPPAPENPPPAPENAPEEKKPAEDITGTPNVPSYPKMVVLDFGHVLSAPFHWTGRQWLLFGGYVGGLAALSSVDLRISDQARAGGANLRFVGDTLEGLGDGRSFALLGGFYLTGALIKDEKARNVALDGLAASLIAAGTITPVLSTVVGRERPTAEQGAFSFHPFGGRSFPSGHATQVFAVVSVIATSYDETWVKAVAYGSGLIGAWMRLERGKHFPTDLVAGALIGTAIGRTVVHYNRELRTKGEPPERGGVQVSLSPVVGAGTYGLSGRLAF